MAQYDGSIRIDSRIDTKNLENDIKEFSKRLENLAEAQRKFLESGGSKESYVYKSYINDIDKLKKELDSLKTAEEKAVPRDEHFNQLKVDLEEYAQALKDLESQGKYFGDEDFDKIYVKWENAKDAVREYQAELNKSTAVGQAKEAERAAKEAERQAAAQRKAEEQAEKALQKENARIQKEIENEAKLQAKEAERQAKIEAEAAEEERLAQIRENAVVNNQHIVDVLERRKQLVQEISDMERAGLGVGYQQYDSARQELAQLDQEIRNYSSSTGEMRSSYVRLGDSVKNAFRTIGKGLIDIPIQSVKKGAQSLLSVFSGLSSIIGGSLKNSFKLLGKVAQSVFSKINKSAKSSNGIFNSGLKNILKYGLGIRSLFVLVNKLRSAITDGLKNLTEYSSNFKNSIDSIKASALTLKNSFAAAFSPLVEIALPYIQRLLDYMTHLVSAAGQLMAAITGRKTYTRAIKQTTAALKEETKASNKQLSSLDKLNNLTTSQSGDTADAGAGDMFEEVPISDKWKDIAQWLKDMWENSDFYELGKLLGEKLKAALDSIPWDKINELAGKLGKSIASLINGFVEVEGLALSIGKTFAEVLNTVFSFLNAFIHELHWESVGKFIAETINGFFQNIDWELIYDTLVTAAQGIGNAINSFVDNLDWGAIATAVSNFFNTLIDTIYVFITTTDWIALATNLGKTISDAFTGIDWTKAGQTVGEAFKAFFSFIATTIENIDWWAVGESVKNFLVGIDWAGVASAFFEAVGAAIGGFAAFIGGLIAEGVTGAKEYFQDKIEEAGGNVVEGILVGIAEALVGIGNWIYENIFTPFIDGFKKAFEINSPSKVMEGMGGFIVSGLLSGLKEKWQDVVDWIMSKIQWLKDKVSGMAGSVSGLFGSGKKSTISYSISHMAEPISPVVAALSNVEIPAYATGQVIPRTMKQHLAILGDNTQETEVVSPISTIEQALENVMSRNNGFGGGDINLNLTVECEGYQLLNIMQKLDRQFYKQNGRHALS